MNINFQEINPSEDKGLRDYQVEYKKRIYQSWQTKKSVMLQMPTGTGKTRLFVSIINDLQRAALFHEPRILILAHRKELIEQIFNEISGRYKIPCCTIMAGNFESNAVHVQVASVQTLNRRKRLDKWNSFGFEFIIVDEAHHVKADSYKRIIRTFPNAKLLGVTATPYRMNGEGFRSIFKELIHSQPVNDFIKQKYLCDYEYYSISQTASLRKQIESIVRFDIEGDYLDEEMIKIMDNPRVLAGIVDTYLKYAKGKKGIVYTINQSHNTHVCNQFLEANIKVKAIDSRTAPEIRSEIVQQFRDGEIEVLCNVNIFSEGFDCPDVEFIQLARPTKSLALFLQQVGRGLRYTEGKEKVLFLDNVGLYNSFGFPSAKRNWEVYFNGFLKFDAPDESPNNHNDEDREVNLIPTFDEGDEEMNLIYSSTSDDLQHKKEEIRNFIQEVVQTHKDCPSHKEAYRSYLRNKNYAFGSVNSWVGVIPNYLDSFIRDRYNNKFSTVYKILDPRVLSKLQRLLFSDIFFREFNSQQNERPQKELARYISFAQEYYVEYNLTPEEKKRKKILMDQIHKIKRLDYNLFYFRDAIENKKEPIPDDIMKQFQEIQEFMDNYIKTPDCIKE